MTFQLRDATDLSFQGEFDIVFSNAALQWVLNHNAVLCGVHSALEPGGRLLFQMAGKGNAQAILQRYVFSLRVFIGVTIHESVYTTIFVE